MVTDYSGYSQKHIYSLARSGNHANLSTAAGHLKSASEDLATLNKQLQSKVTDLSSSWSGDAADEYMNQTNSILSSSNDLANNTGNTGTLIDNAAKLLSWAHDNVPKPPSTWDKIKHGAEEVVAAPGDAVASVTGSQAAGYVTNFVTTGAGGAAAQYDLQQQQKSANESVQVMNQLASGYAQIEAEMKDGSMGSHDGGGSLIGGGTSGSTGGVGGSSGGAPGGYAGYGSGAGGLGAGAGGKYPGAGSVGAGSLKAPSFGDGSSADAGSGVGSGSLGGLGAGAGSGLGVGAGGLGADAGAGVGSGSSLAGAGLGSGALAGLGAGGLGAGGLGAGGAGGLSGSGLGKLGGLGALAKNSGLATGLGKSSMGADGEDAEGAAGAEGEGAGGMMGGSGMGQMGQGNQNQRGQRAGYLTEDPEYWTGKRQVNPSGVIDH